MKLPEPLFIFINPMMKFLLRSPIHMIMSASVLLISFKGRNSGKLYTIPVRYIFSGVDDDRRIQCFTDRSNQWWRNMRGGSVVTLRIAGENYRVMATANHEDPEKIKQALGKLLTQFPGDAPYYEIAAQTGAKISDQSLLKAAQRTVMVEAVLG